MSSEPKFGAFHKKCGGNVVFLENGLVAHRNQSYNKAVVFSAEPFPVGSMFQLKILDRGGGWAGALVSNFADYLCPCFPVLS